MPDVTPLPLSRLTTLRTGGTPERMIDAHTTDELVELRAGTPRDSDQ